MKPVPPRVYENSVVSADADGLTFVTDGECHIFLLSETALQRLARQIDAALKRKAESVRKRKV